MSKAVAGEENVNFEMEWNQATGAGLYDDPVGGWEIPGTKHTCPEKHVAERREQISTEPANSNSPSEAVMLKRLFCIIVAVVAVCFLISAVTLILALTIMISARSTPIASIDCGGAAVQTPTPRGQQLGGSDSTEGPMHIVTPSPPVVYPLENMISELKRNFSVIKTFMIQNISQKLEASVSAINVSFLQELDSVRTSFDSKLNNISKMGFNRSQGPTGPKGSGDFSSCQYKVRTEKLTPGDSITTVGLAEPNGKRVLGVSCSTNYAAEYNLFETVHSNVRRYTCLCRGSSTLFSPFGGQKKSCYLHYWECPLTT